MNQNKEGHRVQRERTFSYRLRLFNLPPGAIVPVLREMHEQAGRANFEGLTTEVEITYRHLRGTQLEKLRAWVADGWLDAEFEAKED